MAKRDRSAEDRAAISFPVLLGLASVDDAAGPVAGASIAICGSWQADRRARIYVRIH